MGDSGVTHPAASLRVVVASTGYEIRIKGRLSDTLSESFEDFTASVRRTDPSCAVN